ncbi:hypothetical protein D7004_18290 [Pedobacter jejuensis]|uniref:Uncharacterized protein n=2 Tax=Pedobacter jejuensis TaxID=1268550 RepID=A0A3N0BNR6_9SPHI|nr:hypothetical protein D7004_18290 [Pedobacter jejuensis]
MKIALMIIFIYMAFLSRNLLSIVYVSLAIVFNPIIPLVIKKQQWQTIDIIVIFVLIVLPIISNLNNRK